MKLVIRQFILVFLLIPAFTLAQNEGPVDRIKKPNEFDNEETDPKYKTYKPDSTKFRLTKKDLTTLCYALNLSKEDSLKCNVTKIWLALTNPFIFDSSYMDTRMTVWGKYNNKLSSGWTATTELEYVKKVLLEGFFNPLIYAASFPELDRTYSWLSKEISNLSAVRGLKEQLKTIKLPDLKEKTVRQVFFSISDSLKKQGFTLMVIHFKKEPSDKLFPFDTYNYISVLQGYEKEVTRIFKNLGLKIEDLKTLKK
jgi:hypothetical protein